MKPSFFIKTHFLGSKIKHLRKSNKMTLEDLSIRCYQIDSSSAPSVSYLSLIESGQRSPSEKLLKSICVVFQKQKDWFYDQNLVENINIDPSQQKKYWDIQALKSESITNSSSFEESKKDLKKLIDESVEEQLVSDVEIGAFLSSGIDSSLIVSIASRIQILLYLNG